MSTTGDISLLIYYIYEVTTINTTKNAPQKIAEIELNARNTLLVLFYCEMFDVFDDVKKLHGQRNYYVKQ